MSLPIPIRSCTVSAALIAAAVLVAFTPAFADLQLTRLIGTGDPAPGLPGVTIGGFRASPQIDNAGNIAAEITLTGNGVNSSNLYAILHGQPGSFSIPLRMGTPAPGISPPLSVYLPFSFALSASGNLGLSSRLRDGPNGPVVDGAVWSGPADNPSVVLRHTDQPPGIPGSGFVLGTEDQTLYTGPGGHLSFRNQVGSPTTNPTGGVWVQESPTGPFSLVAREGDQAPDMPVGVFFSDTWPLSSPHPVNRQ